MKVLLLRANPRKAGYTQRLADWFVKGLRETDAEVNDLDLTARSIQPCLGCYHCWLVTPGRCVHTDDMEALLEEVLAADVIVCATPFYFFSMSAVLKTFFERTLPLMKQGLITSESGRLRNQLRYPDRWRGKKLIAIVAGALKDPALFRPLEETFRLLADGTGLELAGQLTRPEASLLDYPLSKPRTLKLIEAAFVQAGRETGSVGRLSDQTLRHAALPLAADLQHFEAYSNLYWSHATALGEQALDPSAVQRQMACDVRVLMREMVRSMDPRATSRVRAVFAFEFPDAGLAYEVRIDRGHCLLTETHSAKPDLRVRCDTKVWAALFTRQCDVRQALANRELVLEGDKSLFARLGRFFPPPSA